MFKLDVIYGDKVDLKPIEMDDTPNIVKWRNNPRVRKNFIFQNEFTEEMHCNWMNTKVKKQEVIQYIIVEKISGKSIGSIYFRDIDSYSRTAEYGIFIGEDSCTGKGYGSEAAKLFIRYGFNVLSLHRIFLRVLSNNTIAYKSYLHAGFKEEGVARDFVKLNDAYYDVTFMSILETD